MSCDQGGNDSTGSRLILSRTNQRRHRGKRAPSNEGLKSLASPTLKRGDAGSKLKVQASAVPGVWLAVAATPSPPDSDAKQHVVAQIGGYLNHSGESSTSRSSGCGGTSRSSAPAARGVILLSKAPRRQASSVPPKPGSSSLLQNGLLIS